MNEAELETLQTIALPISLGLSFREIGERLGIREPIVSARYKALQRRLWELHQQQDT